MSTERIAIALLSLPLALLQLGCGYALAGRASNIPEDIQQVFIETLVNETDRSQVEQILTQAISEELVTRRRLKVVNTAEEAQAILRGKVLEFRVRPLSFDNDGLANNFEINIAVDMSFERPAAPGEEKGEVVWSNSRYVFRDDYPLEEGDAGFFDREDLAIEETAEKFAETLLTDLLEGF